MIRLKNVCFFVLVLFLSACATVPITGRKQVNLLPESTLLGMSLDSYGQFLSSHPVLPKSDPRSQQVNRVGDKIGGAVESFLKNNGQSSRVKDFAWEFNVVKDDAINAWCMPGGKIVFYTGILPVTKNDAGIATVMGHEIAHAVARHGNERMSQQLAITFGAMGLSVALKEKPQQTQDIFMMAYGVGSTLGTLAYSRTHEYEADKLGMVFMAMAGYNPENAIHFWERMSKLGGAKPPELLSTHPGDQNRVKALQDFLPKALKYYHP